MQISQLREVANMLKREAVMRDMRYSLAQVEQARPIIKQLLNGGEIKTVEGDDNEICLMLDRTCGTDYFQVYGKEDNHLDGIVWGIASRFQKSFFGRPFNTFTIRNNREGNRNVEFMKRKRAIAHNGIYPYLTMQGYYDADTKEILSLAIARTIDIFDCIEKGLCKTQHTNEFQIGQAEFYIIDWTVMKQKGYNIKIWQKPNNNSVCCCKQLTLF